MGFIGEEDLLRSKDNEQALHHNPNLHDWKRELGDTGGEILLWEESNMGRAIMGGRH